MITEYLILLGLSDDCQRNLYLLLTPWNLTNLNKSSAANNNSVFKSVRAFVSRNTLAYHNRDSCVVLFFQQQSAIKIVDRGTLWRLGQMWSVSLWIKSAVCCVYELLNASLQPLRPHRKLHTFHDSYFVSRNNPLF